MTLITVVIPCFNSEAFIAETLQSVLAQDISDIDIVVIDDGSSDSSLEIVSRFPSVRVFQQGHGGACLARNRGIQEARGEWIKFLDSDDLLCPGALARQLDFAAAQDQDVITYWDLEYFDDDTGKRKFVCSALPETDNQVLSLIKRNIQTSCPLHRRCVLQAVGGFDERFLKAQEYELHIRLALNGFRFVHFSRCGSLVREHGAPSRITNRSETPEVITNGQLRQQVVLQQIREAAGGVLPAPIQRHYSQSAFNGVFYSLRQLDLRRLQRSLSTLRQVKPSISSLVVGFFYSIRGQATGLLRRLRRKIGL